MCYDVYYAGRSRGKGGKRGKAWCYSVSDSASKYLAVPVGHSLPIVTRGLYGARSRPTLYGTPLLLLQRHLSLSVLSLLLDS